MIARNCPFEETCARLFVAFFKKYSNDHLRKRAAVALLAVLKRKKAFPGNGADHRTSGARSRALLGTVHPSCWPQA